MCRIGLATMVVALASFGAAPASRPAAGTRPVAATRRTVSKSAATAVRAAIEALTKEYETYLQSPSKGDVRASCNYFKDHPSSDVTSDAIVYALQTPISGEPRTAAYVKWQLLSGLPEKIEEADAKGLLAAYRMSPAPIRRPGIAQEDQQKMMRLTQGRKESDISDITAYVGKSVSQARQDNTPIIAFRDELYNRLPKTPETFAIAFEDAFQRLNAAAEAKDLVKSLSTDLRNWAATGGATPADLARMAKAVRTLADTKGPQYYDEPYWYERGHVLSWKKARATIDSGHALKDVAVFLEEQAQGQPTTTTESKTTGSRKHK